MTTVETRTVSYALTYTYSLRAAATVQRKCLQWTTKARIMFHRACFRLVLKSVTLNDIEQRNDSRRAVSLR